MRQIFKAGLLYAFIGLAFRPLFPFFPIYSLLLPPALISLAHFLDFRNEVKTKNSYIRILAGLTIYVIVLQFLLPIAFWLILGTAPFYIFTMTVWLTPALLGGFILGTIFPNAQFRKTNGTLSALFWVMIIALIIGITGFTGIAFVSHAAKGIGNAF